jgi:hypothetical protein
MVCETLVGVVEELLPRVTAACRAVRTMPTVFERIRHSLLHRCQLWIEHKRGRNFDFFL